MARTTVDKETSQIKQLVTQEDDTQFHHLEKRECITSILDLGWFNGASCGSVHVVL